MDNPNSYTIVRSDIMIDPSLLCKYEIASPRLNSSFIYFLFDKDELVYVGQTINLKHRINEHVRSDKRWTHYTFHSCSDDLSDILEECYIRTYKHYYNKSKNPNYGYKNTDPKTTSTITRLVSL